jgi:hypothetical protein
MSTATNGIVVMQEGFDTGIFIGTTQMFIPRGGAYDLKFTGVDSLGTIESQDLYRTNPNSATVDLDPVDDGEIHVPSMRANNLAFREITYRQRIETNSWITIKRNSDGTYTVTNQSPYPARSVAIVTAKTRNSLGDLKPGQSITRSLSSANKSEPKAKRPPGSPQDSSIESVLEKNDVAVVGTFVGIKPGPQIGAQVPERTSVRFALLSQRSMP